MCYLQIVTHFVWFFFIKMILIVQILNVQLLFFILMYNSFLFCQYLFTSDPVSHLCSQVPLIIPQLEEFVVKWNHLARPSFCLSSWTTKFSSHLYRLPMDLLILKHIHGVYFVSNFGCSTISTPCTSGGMHSSIKCATSWYSYPYVLALPYSYPEIYRRILWCTFPSFSSSWLAYWIPRMLILWNMCLQLWLTCLNICGDTWLRTSIKYTGRSKVNDGMS